MEARTLYSRPGRFTYAEYVKWPDEVRYELIDGSAYLMAAPGTAHQSVSGEMHWQFSNFLLGKPCRVFRAPYDVCLNGAGDDDCTVVQPDLLVVCDRSKIDEKRCNGAPDLVVEILSPSTSSHDCILKFNAYLSAGVREYWIVDPERKVVFTHVLENGRYMVRPHGEEDSVPVYVLEGCRIEMKSVFGVMEGPKENA